MGAESPIGSYSNAGSGGRKVEDLAAADRAQATPGRRAGLRRAAQALNTSENMLSTRIQSFRVRYEYDS